MRARRSIALLALTLATVAAAAPGDGGADPRALRVVAEEGKAIALEIAARSYEHESGNGPTITLVGVVHIGDAPYYRAMQDLLAQSEVVLYETVKPAGAGGAAVPDDADGDVDAKRVERTRAAMRFVASVVEMHRREADGYPTDLDAVRAYAATEGPRLADFVDAALVDAWGRVLIYSADLLEPGYELVSLGADGRTGGSGVDADLSIDAASGVRALEQPTADDNIQVQLARALALSFQLEAIDYDHASWRCSDMAIDDLQREMSVRGADFTLLEETMAGSSLPAKIVKFILGLVRMADAFVEGRLSDTIKVVLIEMLGDEDLLEANLGQIDPAFVDVIIDERNQVVIDDLARLIADERDVESVAVFYGAGHMPDMADRLAAQLGYRPLATRWYRAIEVDLTTSHVSETDVRRIRGMIRRVMRQMQAGR
jgi:hypothetical protein